MNKSTCKCIAYRNYSLYSGAKICKSIYMENFHLPSISHRYRAIKHNDRQE